MEKGKIAKKMKDGFGFIAKEGSDKDFFFHANDLQGITFDDIQEGEEVTFNIGEGRKGPQAIEVSRA